MHQGRRDDAVTPFHCLQRFNEAAHRLLRRALQAEHGHRAKEHRRPRAAAGHAGQDRVQFLDARAVVDVRVLLHPDQDGPAGDHALADVAVQVQHRADRHLGTDKCAHRLQNVALAVGRALGHHRAVQHQQHRVDGTRGAQRVEHGIAQAGIERRRARARRLRPPARSLDGLVAMRRHRAQRVAIAGEVERRGPAFQRRRPIRAVGLEVAQAGGQWREAVGLVHQAGDEDPQRRAFGSHVRTRC